MDTSIRLGFILGRVTIPAVELQPDEWLNIIQEVLGVYKPYLKYLPGFKPIGESLNCHIREYDDRCTDEKIVRFPKGISQKTRCTRVASLSHETEEDMPGYGARFVIEEHLLLTQKGHWLLWKFKYSRQVRQGLGFRAHRSGIREIAEICDFSLLKGLTFSECLARQPEHGFPVGEQILRALHAMASEGVRERENRLHGVQGIEHHLAEILNRIS